MTSARPDEAAADVARRASACADWAELTVLARSCVACADLSAVRTAVVVGDAPPQARLVLVGEAPGAEEDRTGRPFVGRSGRLLDELLDQSGLERAGVAVLNVVKCRPPGNRTPTAGETARCSGWLDRQLDLLAPRLVCTLGLSAAQWFLGRKAGLAASRGTVHDVAGRNVMVTYHPSAALRFGPRGAPRAALLEDLRAVAGWLDADAGRSGTP